jgi:uncharacterized alpha-E superfamily protein
LPSVRPSLLARFASNTFWLGRYVERAESLARILDINGTYARDNPKGPNWQRVLDLHADAERFFENHDDADADSVVNFYVLDRTNPTSISYAIAGARENARSVRHLISTEMWTHVNIFHYRLSDLTRRDIRLGNLAPLCGEIKVACQTFEGIAEGTFFRGEAWNFYHLGKYIERADQTTRVLDMGYAHLSDDQGEALAAVQRDVLLRSVSGYHAFRARFPTSSSADDIATFLLYDERFPRAVTLCVNQMTTRLHAIEQTHGRRKDAAVEKARRALEFSLETGVGHHMTSNRLNAFLDELQVALGRVSDAVAKAYFE